MMMATTSTRSVVPLVLLLLSLASFQGQVDAAAFLRQGQVPTVEVMQSQALRSALLSELMGALGGGHRVTEDRLGRIETSLRPMFVSLPKNEHGNLERPAVRYALHRLFVQRHGMFLKGLEPDGQGWNSSSASGILDSHVPAYVQGLLEERVGGRGLGIHEVAVLAATLEHLIHDEAVDRLKGAYASLGLSVVGKPAEAQVLEAIEVYMVFFVGGRNHSTMSREEVALERQSLHERYPSWPATREFVHEVRRDVVRNVGANDALTFDSTSQVVEEIGERYGRWQDGECRDLKASLVKLGDQGVGRVLLKDFYGDALGGNWQFSESVDYLRELGALDESDPARMSVIVPNYINSPSNCLATSSIFSVCCIDECEAILGHIESQISASDAPPERIAQIVSNLPSASLAAPRSLPSALVTRLDDVARHHSGRVPLHGRLFSQWLHHAYPRECPYPHVSGTTRPQTAGEWMAEGNSKEASTREMMQHTESVSELADFSELQSRSATRKTANKEEHGLLQWEEREELFVGQSSAGGQAPSIRWAWVENCCLVILLAALGAMALSIKDNVMSALFDSDRFGAKMSRAYLPHSHSV